MANKIVIPVITQEELLEAKKKTLLSLPTNPSERGFNPKAIKQALVSPLGVMVEYVNKTIEAINQGLKDFESGMDKDKTYVGDVAPNPDEYNKWINTDGHSEEETNIVIDEPIASTYNLRPATIETTETIVIDEETKEAITVYEPSEGISIIEINENASETIYINNSSDKEIIIIEE